MSTWAFCVLDTPAPQGSKAYKGMVNGHGRLVESSKKIGPWREAVKYAAPAGPCLDGPVMMHVVFTLPRPKSARKSEKWPCKSPDIDKILRGLLDPLVSVGLLADDARVVDITRLAKVWTGYDDEALPVPGVLLGATEIVPGAAVEADLWDAVGTALYEVWKRYNQRETEHE